MTREEFKILAKAMKAVYTEPSFMPDQNAFDVWYEMLRDLEYTQASNAIKKHMMNSDRLPKISHIRQEACRFNGGVDELNEMAAWGLVCRALKRCGYYADEEFDKLPAIVQRAIVSPAQLKEWATMEDIDGRALNVMQSNFMRTFRAEQERQKETDKLSPDLKKLINSPAGMARLPKKGAALSIAEERETLLRDTVPAPKGLRERARMSLAEKGQLWTD